MLGNLGFSLRSIAQRARPAVSSWAAPKALPVLAAQRMFSVSARLADEEFGQQNRRYNGGGRDKYSRNENNGDLGERRQHRPADAMNNFVSKTATTIEESRREKRVVQISNVPFQARWEDIFRVFGYYGEVERIKFPKQGFCYVHYVDVSSVSKAVQALNNTYFHSRRIFVSEPEHEYVAKTTFFRQHEPCETVYLGNLPYDLKRDELDALIEPLGTAEDVRVPSHPNTGLLRGFAHIQFSTAEQAKEALEKLQGTELRGRKLILNYASGKRTSPGESKSLGGFLAQESAQDAATEQQAPEEPVNAEEQTESNVNQPL
ncbi:uncharacterized protein BROUX77_001437 [Berkeleyomyces rouxiae]|uniref:uncharacterized protein n=1 Tax=Berkeleyomyces rouxiae TaxID=2035830 RepID=UPI003B79E429